MTVFERLLPRQIDNSFSGSRVALWLLGLFVALKFVMSFNSIVFTETIATGADGLPLARFTPEAARVALRLFALIAVGQLALAAVSAVALVRYRAMVPLIYLILLGEQIGRRLVAQSYAAPHAAGRPVGWYMNLALLALLALGLALSLVRRRRAGDPE